MDKFNVLVVEDEAIVSMDLRNALEAMGHSVPPAIRSGEEAIAAASRLHPDLVLMDIRLSGEMDGIDAAALIREQFDVPVVYLTAYADEATLERAKLTEPFGYMLKPMDPRMLQFVVEVTIYKHQIERRLRESERWLFTVLRSTSDAIATTDLDGNVNLMNPAAEAMLGSARGQAQGKKLAELFIIAGQPASVHPVWRALDENAVVPITQDACLVVGEGNVIPISGSAAPIRDDQDKVTGVVLTFRDASESKRAEAAIKEARDNLEQIVQERTSELKLANEALGKEITERQQVADQLIQSQKMESVGRLAGGLAHDFNNLLVVISGYTDLLRDKFDPDDPSLQDLEEIAGATERATNLTAQLLSFSRRQISQPQAVNLNDLVVAFYPMLRRLIPEEIELVTLPAPDLWPVRVDPCQFEQVLLNLAVNARDAMRDGGTITVETANITLGENFWGRDVEAPCGDCVVLTVSDTGTGMTEDIQRQVFDPFFTTKEVGKGTGLGLSICYGIVKQSGGHIEALSTLGQGASFRVYLARIAESAGPEPNLEGLIERPQGTETILLVEDTAPVRHLAARVLRENGYCVLEAANGEEAVRVAQDFPSSRIDLLLTDLVMPQMGGLQLVDSFRVSNPGTKILVTSGYAHETSEGNLDPNIPFLRKPYLPATLVSKVREVLDD